MHHHAIRAIDQHLTQKLEGSAEDGCSESRSLLSRRAMLGVSAGLFSSFFLPPDAHADTDVHARLLVIVLRGGMDGIGMVIPAADPFYGDMRRELALSPSQTLSLGSDFALHPSLKTLHGLYGLGQAAIIPAAGIPVRNRSHFECQDNLENGLPGNVMNATGWLNRLFGALPAGDPIRARRAIEVGEVPLILRGPERVLGWSPTWFDKSAQNNVYRLRRAYETLDVELWNSLKSGLITDTLAFNTGATTLGNVSSLRKAFIGAARLMRARTGPRVAVLSINGWDTHAQQGGITGVFNDRLVDLDQAIADLKDELGTTWANTIAICVSEFGRTASTNGDGGTDHGIGTAALAVGGAVKGGIYGDWPGLSPEQLLDGNALRPTVDLRSVFKGILQSHIGIPDTVLESVVFPESPGAKPLAGIVSKTTMITPSPSKFNRPPTLQESSPLLRYRRHNGTQIIGSTASRLPPPV